MTLHSGWDSFTPAPGTVDKMQCRICGEDLEVRRNCNGPTGYAESLAGMKHLHDHFYCKHSEEDWHKNAYALKQQQENSASTAVKEIIEAELVQVIVNRKPSEGWEPSWKDL